MPSKNPKIQKALKDGVITKKQYDKLSDGLLLGIIAKKSKGKATTTSKGMVKKTGKLAYEKRGSSTGGKSKGKVQPKGRGASQGGKSQGKKETRHKLGKEAHKRGRPKGGSDVKIES